MTSANREEEALLWGKLRVQADEILQALLVRISDPEDIKGVSRLRDSLSRQLEGSPLAAALQTLPPDLSDLNLEGWKRVGFTPIYFSDLDPSAPTTFLGYAAIVDSALMMFVQSSAAESNLPPASGSRVKRGRNAFTEFVLEAIESLPNLGLLAVPRFDRIAREVGFFGPILSELRNCGVKVWDDKGQRDLAKSGDMILAVVESTVDGDAEAVKRKMTTTAGRINAIAKGTKEGQHSERDTSWQSLPPGYGPSWQDIGNGRIIPVKRTIEVRSDLIPMVQKYWTLFADGFTASEAAEALTQWPLRDLSGKTIGDVGEIDSRTAIVYGLWKEKWLTLHTTGKWLTERKTGAPVDSLAGFKLHRIPGDKRRRRMTKVEGSLPVPMLDGLPWGLTQDVQERAWERMRGRATKTPRDHGSENGKYPLSSSLWIADDGYIYQLLKVDASFQLRRQTNRNGKWDAGLRAEACPTLASLQMAVLFSRMGRALEDRLRGIAEDSPELKMTSVESVELRALRLRVIDLTDQMEGLDTDAIESEALARIALRMESDTSSREAEASRHLTSAAAARQQGALLQRIIDDLQTDIEATSTRFEDVADLRRPIGVAAALQRFIEIPAETYPLLRSALKQLGISSTLRCDYEGPTEELTCYSEVSLPMADGSCRTLALTFKVPNSAVGTFRNDRMISETLVVRDWATGASLLQLAAEYKRTEFWVMNRLKAWMKRSGLHSVGPLIDCPIPTTRQAIVSAIDPTLAEKPALSEGTLNLLRDPYLNGGSRKWGTWASYDHTSERRVLNTLLLADGRMDVPLLDVASGEARTVDHIHLSHIKRPPLCSASKGERTLKRCPHCNEYLSHFLLTPETACAPLICLSCKRLPLEHLADAPLPDEYLHTWNSSRTSARPYRSIGTELVENDSFEPANPELARCSPELVSVKQARRILGLTPDGFRGLLARSDLTPAVARGRIRYWRRAEIEALTNGRKGRGKFAIKDGWLSPQETALVLNVPEHRVRWYVKEGHLAHKKTAGGRVRINPDLLQHFTPPEGDQTGILNVMEAARQVDLSHETLRRAIRLGELRSVKTVQGTTRVALADLGAWMTKRSATKRPSAKRVSAGFVSVEGKLSVAAAAKYLGMSSKQLRTRSNNGLIPSELTEGRWRLFDVYDLDEWLNNERASH